MKLIKGLSKAEYWKKYYQENKQAISQRKKKYREENKQAIAEYGKKYREERALFEKHRNDMLKELPPEQLLAIVKNKRYEK